MTNTFNQTVLRHIVSLLVVVAFLGGVSHFDSWANNPAMGFEVLVDADPLESDAEEETPNNRSVVFSQSQWLHSSLFFRTTFHSHNTFLDRAHSVRAPPVFIPFS